MDEAAEPFSLSAAWDELRYWMQSMVALFGAPATIAASLLLRRSTRADILGWLVPCEAGVRRVLLMGAMLLPRPKAPLIRASRRRAAKSPCTERQPAVPLPEDSKQWRVSFVVWPAVRTPAGAPPQTPADERGPHCNAAPLARRIEAVMRVCENPGACIAKLARRIYAKPAITRAAFRPYRARLRGADHMLREIQRETALALAKLDYG